MRLYILTFIFTISIFCGCSRNSSDTPIPSPEEPDTSPVDSTFRNPLLSSGADPWVIYKNGYYYFNETSGSNFITLRKTKYMSELENSTSVNIWSSSGFNYVWAPELHYINNTWYMYFSAVATDDDTHHTYVLQNKSNDPTSSNWTLIGQVTDPSGKRAIDASVFEYKGVYYMVWSGEDAEDNKMEDICIAKLSDPWTLDGERVVISKPTYDWEKIGNATNEGPEAIINPNGDLFLTYSASDCCSDYYAYCLGLLSLKTGGNPLNAEDWSKSDTAVFSTDASKGAYAPGHNGFFMSPDSTENWIIYHANSEMGGPRNPRIQKFNWNDDGTPNFGKPMKIHTSIVKPSGEY